VVLDVQLVDERRGRTTGPHAGELAPGVLDGPRHPLGRALRHDLAQLRTHTTRVPRSRPSRMDLMLPSVIRSNTTIGTRLSMHMVIDVASITFSPRFSTSR